MMAQGTDKEGLIGGHVQWAATLAAATMAASKMDDHLTTSAGAAISIDHEFGPQDVIKEMFVYCDLRTRYELRQCVMEFGWLFLGTRRNRPLGSLSLGSSWSLRRMIFRRSSALYAAWHRDNSI